MEVWWELKTVGKRLEAVQGRKLLGASTMAGEAVHGEMGWRKLEERREEKKVLYGWRFQGLGEEADSRKIERVRRYMLERRIQDVAKKIWFGES